jgi:hypothetical protein
VEAIREEGRRREALSSSRKEERTREQSRQQNKMLQCSESLYRIVRVVMIRQGKGARRKGLCVQGMMPSHITWGRWRGTLPV